jgi:predicted enzyme related to lactoylglutathione lyase
MMGRPVVHFEIIGNDPAGLRGYYGELFDWEFQMGDATTEKVSQPGTYGFVDGSTTGEGDGINGGIGGGRGHEPRVLFYVGVPDVESALQKAESLGGKRLMGPEPASGDFAVGRFIDPEGNVVGVAGPSA